ncbi:MAG: hypothetical protein KC931_22035, partial [Candidatus Omnitrophica bacterium]|nr:hypothetical protein [Candidatus Omnitrophota bacterium]
MSGEKKSTVSLGFGVTLIVLLFLVMFLAAVGMTDTESMLMPATLGGQFRGLKISLMDYYDARNKFPDDLEDLKVIGVDPTGFFDP